MDGNNLRDKIGIISKLSHPSWVCGLKLLLICMMILTVSHTLRGCVDWNCCLAEVSGECEVTPFVGVWIETLIESIVFLSYLVTPFVGVWIETYHDRRVEAIWKVTPFVGVWIETDQNRKHRYNGQVTPFVGVWIETLLWKYFNSQVMSHPSWVCGLKPFQIEQLEERH